MDCVYVNSSLSIAFERTRDSGKLATSENLGIAHIWNAADGASLNL